jgi:hypothetical protein
MVVKSLRNNKVKGNLIYNPMTLILIISVFILLLAFVYFMYKTHKNTEKETIVKINIINPQKERDDNKNNQQSQISQNIDRSVLEDPLYPPYGRPPLEVATIPKISTRGSYDNYRLVGYMVSEESKDDVWKLFGKEKYRGGQGDFYAISANKNLDGIKVFLTKDTVIGDRLDNIYTIPDQIRVNHSLFNHSIYDVSLLPYNDQ